MKVVFLFMMCIIAMFANSQTISVSSFKLLDTDLTANTAGTTEMDQNGETAALIKVVTTQTGFTFDGGALGIVKTKQTPGEVWVYIPKGSKKISIKHPQLGVLRDYYYPTAIEAARTYEMVLNTGTVQTIVNQARTSQYVVFQLEPANAVVELDGELLETINGVASKMKNLGTYSYRIQAPNHLLEAGSVTVDDPKNKKIVKVTLKPNFAHVTINVDNDAEIWMNGEKKGIGSWKGEIGAGIYEFEAKKEGYRSTSLTQEIKASPEMQMIQLQSPTPIFGEINLTSNPLMSDVYIDGVPSGQTPLILSDVLIGKHKIRITHDGYRDYVSDVFVEEGKVSEIDAVLTTTVSVSINCNAPNADFYIDGRLEGNASGIKIIEVGKHKIEVKPKAYDNFTTYNEIIDFNGSVDCVEIRLEPRNLKIYFESDLPNTYLFVDNKMITNKLGNDKFNKVFSSGEHELVFRCAGKREIKKKVIFGSSQNAFTVSFNNKDIYVNKIIDTNNGGQQGLITYTQHEPSIDKQQEKTNYSVSYKQSIADSGPGTGYASTFPVLSGGKKAAYIKLFINDMGKDGFSVDCEGDNLLKQENHGDMFYLYVKEGTRNISILKNKEIICSYKFEIPIESGRDYLLQIDKFEKGTKSFSFGNYNGELLSGNPHGHGTMNFNNGEKYEGEWDNGYFKKGKFTYSNGDVYEGEWAMFLRNGFGTCLYADGHKYEGIWVADEPNIYNYSTTKENASCAISKIERLTNETKIHMTFRAHGNWCSINKDTYIQIPETKQNFKLIKADGIAISPETTTSASDVIFILTFPVLPKNVKKIDLIEPGDSSWKFWGINIENSY